MSTLYVGDTTWAEASSATLTTDPWGMDVLTRTYEGSKLTLDTFLATYGKRRDVADTDYPWLYWNKSNAEIGRAFARVTLEYKGMNTPGSGNSPDSLQPVITSGYRTNDTQLQFVADTLGESSGLTCEITYNAPYSRIYYVRRGRPTKQEYRNTLELTEDGIRIVSRRGTPGDIRLFGGKSWRAASNQKPVLISGALQAYNGVVEVITTQFEWVPAGQWYECTETNEARIVPLDLANGLLDFIIK